MAGWWPISTGLETLQLKIEFHKKMSTKNGKKKKRPVAPPKTRSAG
jgi:hypothetical protein